MPPCVRGTEPAPVERSADGRFAFQRREPEIAAEARLDGVYVIRASLPKDRICAEAAVASYKSLALASSGRSVR